MYSFNSRILYQVGTSLRSVLGASADATAPVPSLRSGTVAASRLHGVRARPLPCGRRGRMPTRVRIGTGCGGMVVAG